MEWEWYAWLGRRLQIFQADGNHGKARLQHGYKNTATERMQYAIKPNGTVDGYLSSLVPKQVCRALGHHAKGANAGDAAQSPRARARRASQSVLVCLRWNSITVHLSYLSATYAPGAVGSRDRDCTMRPFPNANGREALGASPLGNGPEGNCQAGTARCSCGQGHLPPLPPRDGAGKSPQTLG